MGCSRPPPRVPWQASWAMRSAPWCLSIGTNDPRSSIVDAPSTMVVDGTQVKVLA